MSLLKEKRIDSKQSLMELTNVLDKLSACGTADAITDFTNEVIILKEEARSLLEAINFNTESVHKDKEIPDPGDNSESIFEDFSFKERIDNLKQKIHSLSFKNPD